MDAETRRAREQMKKLPLKARLSNYWYYYRIHIFVGILCLFIFGTAIVQCATKIDYDMTVSMYSTKLISDESIAEITELLKAQCKDINEDEKVNIAIISSFGDITSDKMDEMSMAVLQKFQLELAANSSAGYIVDEPFKDLMVDGYDCPEDTVIEISKVPRIKEILKLGDGQKLYWISGFKNRDKEEISQFDNGELVEKYLRQEIE